MKAGPRKKAKDAGEPRYYTGVPCKNGHLSERGTSRGNCLECHKVWRGNNADKCSAQTRRYRRENPDKVVEFPSSKDRERHRAWRQSNPERANSHVREWKKRNRPKVAAWNRNRRAAASGGKHSAEEVADIFRRQRGKCGYCRQKLTGGYHVDHIQPLARAGTNRRCNLQILCAPCNLSKGAKDPIDFTRSIGLLI